jgi:V/A-type H+-transporting ATPase subunit E
MGLESVIEEIREKGRKESEALKKEADTEVSSRLSEARSKADHIRSAARDEVEKQVSRMMGQEVSAAQLVVRREILNAQKGLLDEVYSGALHSLSQLPPDFHKDAIRALLIKAKADIPAAVVHCSPRDLPTLQGLLAGDSSLNGFIAGSTVDIPGGVIVESKDGQLQLDYSYRTFLDSVWESGLKDASDLLFG